MYACWIRSSRPRAALLFALVSLLIAAPRGAQADSACGAGSPTSGCCAGDTLRSCAGADLTASCASEASCAAGALVCGHEAGTASTVACLCPSSAELQSFNPFCPGYCQAGCTGDSCPGACATGQTCVHGTCLNKGCGHLFDWTRTAFGTLTRVSPIPQPSVGSLRSLSMSNWIGLMDTAWGFGVLDDGTVVPYGEFPNPYGRYGDIKGTAWQGITQARQVATSAFHTTVLLSDGTLVAWGGAFSDYLSVFCNPGYKIQPPAGLTGVVSIAASPIATAALRSDGTIVVWGVDTTAVSLGTCSMAVVDYGPLTAQGGFKALFGGGAGFIGVKNDGTVVQAVIPHFGVYDSFAPVPAGLTGVVSAAVGVDIVLAVKADGTIVTWGAKSVTLVPPPADLLPLVAVASLRTENGPLKYTNFALQVDGTVRAWGDGASDLNKLLSSVLVSANALEPNGFGALYCTGGCGAISDVGCCEPDFSVRRCTAEGVLSTTGCGDASCGWQASAAAYQCSTPGQPAPAGTPPRACPCVPSCKNPDGSLKQCVSDGCGGICGKGVCDDGNACTLGDYCYGTTCYWQTPLACDDGNACTVDGCDALAGCTHTAQAASCNDGNPCTTGDTCTQGACTGAQVSCDDGNPCTIDTCGPELGCAHSPEANYALCDDANACSLYDGCWLGWCLPDTYLACDDGNPCTDDTCAPATGCTHTANSAPCSDNNVCTGGDYCTGTTCYWTTPLACDDGNPCTDDTCDAAKGCTHTANGASCDDGNSCNGADHCAAGKCVGANGTTCDDGNPCTTDPCLDAQTCNAPVPLPDGTVCASVSACLTSGTCSAGVCKGASEVSCDDGNPCTNDGCNAATGCTHVSNAAACSDSNACTVGDACLGGTCAAGATPLDCNDNNPCTDDSCAGATGCVHANTAKTCNDKNACTQSDTCQAGVCVGTSPLSCDDGNVCTTDTCNALVGCKHAFSTAPCDDSNACTRNDGCWQGKCSGSGGLACDDKNPCTDDACDPVKGCTFVNNTKPCFDGDACSIGDTCQGGSCKGGNTVAACDDKNVCTMDRCKPKTGCEHLNNVGLACDDKNECTTGDACQAGICQPGWPVGCGDKNPCTDDACKPSLGCTHTNNTSICADANPCTSGDRCAGGQCVGGGPTNCDDYNACTADACDASKGCTHPFLPYGAPCDDGDPCLLYDRCSGWGTCSGTPACVGTSCTMASGSVKCACQSGQVQIPGSVPGYYGCCTPSCVGQTCGDDGCGGSCGTCATDEVCTTGPAANSATWCVPKVACYGKAPTDGGCCAGRTVTNCQAPATLQKTDCSAIGLACGWNPSEKRYGCTLDGKPDPSGAHPFACPKAPACVPDCNGATIHYCGPDGCGGTCGTCTSPYQCSPTTYECLPPCEGVYPLVGCVTPTAAGDVVSTCPSIDAKAAGATQVTCPAGVKAGWDAKQGRFVCGGTGAPPADVTAACPQVCTCGVGVLKRECGDLAGCWKDVCGTCPGQQVCTQDGHCCTPDCNGKICGDDGCGGSCGSCKEGLDCAPGGDKCGVAACGTTTSAGACEGTLSYCTGNQLITKSCASLGMTCGTVPEGSTCVPTAPLSCGAAGGANQCGADAGPCDCYLGCVVAGTCCPDYDEVCGATIAASPACPNGKCEAVAGGETCLTCPADCGACAKPTGATLDAPWPQIIADAGKPAAKARYLINPLDDVRPASPPTPLRGLVSDFPDLSRYSVGGSPRTAVVNGKLGAIGGISPLKGMTPSSYGVTNILVGGSSYSSFGVLRVRPDRPFRAHAGYNESTRGGFTAAGWVRVPASSFERPNGLASAQALVTDHPEDGTHAGSGVEVCRVARPQDPVLKVECPDGSVITSIDVYYGEVKDGQNYFPLGQSCDAFRAVPRTYTCNEPPEAACVGKGSCTLAPGKDFCSPTPTKPGYSTLMARAICGGGTSKATLNLIVDDNAGGRKLRLDVAGEASLRSTSPMPADTWVHVAVTFEPFGPSPDGIWQDGRLSLYVDGQEEAVAPRARIDRLYEWDWGGARIEGATSAWPTFCGEDGSTTQSPQNVASVADYDDLFLYERALEAREVRGLQARLQSGLLRVWPPLEASVMARDNLYTSGGALTAVPVEVQHLRDAGASRPLRADFMGLSLAPGATLSMPTIDPFQLITLQQWTLLGWVRPSKVGAGTTLFELKQDADVAVKVAMSADCGGRGLVATFSDGKTLSTTDCSHVVPPGEWTFVALTQTASGRRLDVDGKVATGPGAAPLLTVYKSARMVISSAADLGWVALHERALTRDQVASERASGPAVWLDGAVVKPPGAPVALPRDWAAFHNTGESGPADVADAFESFGNPFDGPEANFSASWGWAYVRVPAKGRLRTTGAPLSGHVTIVESIHILTTNLSVDSSKSDTFFQLQSGGAITAEGSVTCRKTVGSPSLPLWMNSGAIQCTVSVTRADDGGASKSYTTAPFVLSPVGPDVLLRVAVSLGDTARVAVGYRAKVRNQIAFMTVADAKAASTIQAGAGGKVLPLEPSASPLSPTTSKESEDCFAVPGQTYSSFKGVYDARIYPRALGDAELATVVQVGCEALGCDAQHRACAAATVAGTADWLTGLDLGGCGACQAGFREAYGECVPLGGPMSPCLRDAECASGLTCVHGQCLQPGWSEACAQSCLLEGHTCAKLHADQGYGCDSRTCLTNFSVAANHGTRKRYEWCEGCVKPALTAKDVPVVSCVWAPPLSAEERCTSGLECDSGLCAVRETKVYSVSSSAKDLGHGRHPWPSWAFDPHKDDKGNPLWWEGPYVQCSESEPDTCAVAPKIIPTQTEKVCAAKTPSLCEARGMQPRAVKATRWDGDAAEGYVCDGCSTETYADKPMWVQSFSMMTPAACETLYRNYFRLLVNRAYQGSGGALDIQSVRGVRVGDDFYVSAWKGLAVTWGWTFGPVSIPLGWAGVWTWPQDGSTLRGHGDILEHEPTLPILRRLLLSDAPEDQNGPVTPMIISKLQKAGVGDDLIAWESMPEWRKAAYRRPYRISFLGSIKSYLKYDWAPIGACNVEKYTFSRDMASPGYFVQTYQSPFFRPELNRPVCVPTKYPEGTQCPPPEESATTKPISARPTAGAWCDSGFCAADTHECEYGDQRHEQTFGNVRSDGQSGSSSNDLGPLKLGQDDGGYYRFQKIKSDPSDTVTLQAGATDLRDSTLHARVKKAVGLFGADMITALAVSVTMHGAPAALKPEERLSYKPMVVVANIEPPNFPPTLPKFACGKFDLKDPSSFDFTQSCKPKRTKLGVGVSPQTKKSKDDTSGSGAKGKSPTASSAKKIAKDTAKDVAAGVVGNVLGDVLGGGDAGEVDEDMIDVDGSVDLLRFSLPLPLENCSKSVLGFSTVFGRLCYASKSAVGPVDILVRAELYPEVALTTGAEMDPKTFEPALVLKPSVGMVLAVKGGIGKTIGIADIFVGIKAAITIIEIAFPVKFAIGFLAATDQAPGKGGLVPDLWTIKEAIGVDLEMTFLKVALGVFFEVGVWYVKATLDYDFFTFDGFRLRWALEEFNVKKYKVDFQWSPPIWTPSP